MPDTSPASPGTSTVADRRGVDLSSAPEHVQMTLNRIMHLEDQAATYRGLLDEVYAYRLHNAGYIPAELGDRIGKALT